MSDFRRAKALDAKLVMFESFCLEIRLILNTSLDFLSQLACVIERKSPYHFVSIFISIPGDGGIIILEM